MGKRARNNYFGETEAKKFSNLKKETDIQLQEAQRVPNKMNPNRATPRHSVIKMAKFTDKEKSLKITAATKKS